LTILKSITIISNAATKIGLILLICLYGQSLEAGKGGGKFITLFESKVSRAQRYFDHHHYVQALNLFEKASQKKKQNLTAKLGIIDCYRQLNLPEETLPYFAEVIEEAPAIYQYYYAESLMATGQYQEAEMWITRYRDETNDFARVNEILTGLQEISKFYKDSSLHIVNPVAINSDLSDFAPTFYNDGLVFVSARNTDQKRKFAWDNTPYLDLYYAPFTKDHSLDAPMLFDENINSKYHEGPVTFFDQGQRMLFTRSNYHHGKLANNKSNINMISMYAARYVDNSWQDIEPFEYNNKEYSTGHPTVSSDEKTLYFISDMPGGYGGTDIYVSTWQDDQWTTPKNLGPTVNTTGNEMFPYIHSDGTLYFASNGKGGLGGLDIFMVNATDYDSVANLGYPINSSKDDFGMIVSEDGTFGYLSSSRQDNHDDLFEIQFHPPLVDPLLAKEEILQLDSLTELPDTLLTEEIDDSMIQEEESIGPVDNLAESDPMNDLETNVDNFIDPSVEDTGLSLIDNYSSSKEFLGPDKIRADLPSVSLDQIAPRTMHHKAQLVWMEGMFGNPQIYLSTNDELYTLQEDEGVNYLVGKFQKILLPADIYLSRSVDDLIILEHLLIDHGFQLESHLTINNIYYDFDRSFIREDAAVELEKLANLLRRHASITIYMGSHTDMRGSDQYNIALSNRRAQSAIDYLVDLGIAEDRLSSQGYGETNLTNGCGNNVACNETQHQLNRRTEFQLINQPLDGLLS
jgi:outer membrane protein OmpA-like peptidoglycan-associated protein/tetratricopeptide (TPR) repeat protein